MQEDGELSYRGEKQKYSILCECLMVMLCDQGTMDYIEYNERFLFWYPTSKGDHIKEITFVVSCTATHGVSLAPAQSLM